jgi:hypothetical protein
MRSRIETAGIALSCLISVVATVLLGINADDWARSALLWVLYVFACGLAINLPPDVPPKRVFGASLYPAGAFLLASTTFWLLGMLAGGAFHFDMSGLHGDDDLRKALVFNLVAFVTVPGIAAAIYSRVLVIEYVARLKDVSVEELRSLNTKISLIGTIVATVLLVLLSVIGGRKENVSTNQSQSCQSMVDSVHHRVVVEDSPGQEEWFQVSLAGDKRIVGFPSLHTTSQLQVAIGKRITLLDNLQMSACNHNDSYTMTLALAELSYLLRDLASAKCEADIRKMLARRVEGDRSDFLFGRDVFFERQPLGHEGAPLRAAKPPR